MDDPQQPADPSARERAQPEMAAPAWSPDPAGAGFTPMPYAPTPTPAPFAPVPYPGAMSGPVPSAPPAYPAPTYSDPAYPTYPMYPAYPPYAPAPYAGGPYVPTLPGLSPLPPKRPPWLARAMPGAVPPILVLWALSLLAGAAILGLVVTQGEWADGARFAAMVSIALGTICLLGLLIRFIGGYRARQGLLLGLAAVVVLGALAATGLRLEQPLDASQARAFEASHSYARALQNFRLTGASAPNSRDLARVYDEWGEQLERQGDYADAVTDFHLVRDTYYGATAEVDRAWTDLLRADVAWLGRDGVALSYATELTMLADLTGEQGRSACDATCKATVATALPEDQYLLGEQLVAQQNYSLAITYFEQVQSQYKSSPYAKKAHVDAAKAYYTMGQGEIATTCQSALMAFHTLARSYADTPQAGQAQAMLQKPATITGYLNAIPAGEAPTMYLSAQADPNAWWYSHDYRSGVGAGGAFTFASVTPGSYMLTEVRVDGSEWYWTNRLSTGPLCPQDVGSFSYGPA